MSLLTIKFVTDISDADYQVIEFHGEMDQSNIRDTESKIAEHIAVSKHAYIVFDLSDLRFINSEGMGFIVATHARLAKKGVSLLLCSPPLNVRDIFELVGLPKIVPVLASIGDVIKYIKK